jgi:hypothetical protein
MSPWISLRMNDCHCNDNMDHPFHGSFWKKNPQFHLKNDQGYFGCCLDYAHQEVRDYFMALIVEALERYDLDGLELDFMREPYLFSAGKESAGAPILTAWLREVRKRVADTGARRGHPVRLGVRVPSRPEVAAALGLDAKTWVKEGLIDLLVVTPRWSTIEFDMPMREWREMVGASKVTLAGGLEVGYRPYWDDHVQQMETLVSPELAAGAAIVALSQGADAVYLFNFFQKGHPCWSLPVYQRTLQSMASLDSLQERPRTIGITYRDITAPGEHYRAPLPATGKEVVFPMRLGPIPGARWRCELLIGLAPSQDASLPTLMALVNGTRAEVLRDVTTEGALRLITFRVPMVALAGTEVHEVKIASTEQTAMTVKRVEVSFLAPDADGSRERR